MSSSARKGFFRTNCCLLPARSVLAQDNCKHPDNHCHAAADLDNRVLPGNTLIMELTDGLYIWPLLAHPEDCLGGCPQQHPRASINLRRRGMHLLTRSAILNGLTSHAQWGVSLLSPCVHSSVLPCPRQLLQRIQWAKPVRWLAGSHKQE